VDVIHQTKQRKRRILLAFTLVDALVAATLVVGIAALSIPTFLSTVVVHRSVERATVAREAARNVIENIREFGVNNLIDGSYALTRFGTVESLAALPNGTGTVTITASSPTVRKAVVRILWNSGVRQGRQRSFTTVTLLTPGGVSP
jgi:hypothetical protein